MKWWCIWMIALFAIPCLGGMMEDYEHHLERIARIQHGCSEPSDK